MQKKLTSKEISRYKFRSEKLCLENSPNISPPRLIMKDKLPDGEKYFSDVELYVKAMDLFTGLQVQPFGHEVL